MSARTLPMHAHGFAKCEKNLNNVEIEEFA